MNERGRTLVFALFVFCFSFSTAAQVQATSGVVDPDASQVSTNGGFIMMCPARDGESLQEAGIDVLVILVDGLGDVIINYPFQDVWLDDAATDFNQPGPVIPCPGGTSAHGNSNRFGEMTISDPLGAGGWTDAGAAVFASGERITGGMGPVLPILLNSPDIDPDHSVNMVDVALFAQDYISGGYAFRSDIVNEGTSAGKLDLADVGRFMAHLGHTCP